jgi:tetratricopeptide (TPR) repeat protein
MTEAGSSPARTTQRSIRVFISSTFQDMQAERDELVKRIFPQLRKLCEQRGVGWGEVDLRWGVTEEQKAEGKVLPICLEEIRRCRPYFIGLLGERYGWIPEKIPQELTEVEPWLSERNDRSVTELEILHGVLNDPAMAEHTFFYFRSPVYGKTLPARERDLYCEKPTLEEIKALGREEAQRRSELRSQKLAALKDRIRKSGLPLREEYPNPRALGDWILEDLRALIDKLYPEAEKLDPLDREAAEHEAFAESLAKVYIGRKGYFDRLDAHADGEEPPLVVLGESGAGKSALLANWALRYRGMHPEELLLMHFIGATPFAADWEAMLRRILAELKRRFDLPVEIPDQPDALREAFANGLHMAAVKGRVLLVLDGLNQLADRGGAQDLVWLPPTIPTAVRLVLSTLPGKPLAELQRRGWPTLSVDPLGSEERKQLIPLYLAQYSKTLGADQTDRIAASPQTANPLFLRTLLNELRLFGMHEQLDARIDVLLQAATPEELYEMVLSRCEQDYGRDRPGLVSEALSLLWAARRGLSEAELLDMLGSHGKRLPGAYWSPLYLALEQSLINRSGLIGFAHSYLRQAVRNRFLPDEKAERAAHLRLAAYYQKREIDPRKIDELPWQLERANSWRELYDLLADVLFCNVAWVVNPYEVKAYWVKVEENFHLGLLKAYHPVLADPARYGFASWNIASLLNDTGHLREALSLRAYLAEYYRQKDDPVQLSDTLLSQANTLFALGELEQAKELNKEQEQLYRRLGDKLRLQRALGNQAIILQMQGDLDGAMALHREEEQICRELGNKYGLQKTLVNQATILFSRGDLDGALTLQKEAERLCRELGIKDGLLVSLGNQGLILYTRGDLDGAMALYKEGESLCRELGEKIGLQKSLLNQATLLFSRGDLNGAWTLQKEAERLCREAGNKDGLVTLLGNQGIILKTLGDLDGAMALYQDQERLVRELGKKDWLAACLGNQANILRVRGDLARAMDIYREVERLWREVGEKDSLANCLGNQGIILGTRGDIGGAMALHKQAESLYREVGDKKGLQGELNEQAMLLFRRGDMAEAMMLHKEVERICRELEYKDGLQNSLGNQAMLLQARGDFLGALTLLQEAEKLCREIGNKNGLQGILLGQANIHYARGNHDEAMTLYKEQERLCRELGNLDGLRATLGNQGVILEERGDLDGAIALHQEEEKLCRQLGNKEGLGNSLSNQANILRTRHDIEGALALYQEAGTLFRELGNKKGLALLLINQGLLFGRELNQPNVALPLVDEAYRLAAECGYDTLARNIQVVRDQFLRRLD